MVSGVTGITGVSVPKHVVLELHFNHVNVTPRDLFMVGSTVSAFDEDTGPVIPRYIPKTSRPIIMQFPCILTLSFISFNDYLTFSLSRTRVKYLLNVEKKLSLMIFRNVQNGHLNFEVSNVQSSTTRLFKTTTTIGYPIQKASKRTLVRWHASLRLNCGTQNLHHT